MPLAEERGAGQQRQHRVGEEEDDDDVDDRGQAERVGEAADVAGGQQVEHDGGDQVDGVGDDHGALGPLPPRLDGRRDRASLTDLVPHAFEVDDERVGRHTDRQDQAGDAGHGQPEVLRPAEQRDAQVGQRGGREQRGHGNQAESAVLDQRVDHDQHEADGAREQTLAELVGAERRADGVLRLDAEGHLQGT